MHEYILTILVLILFANSILIAYILGKNSAIHITNNGEIIEKNNRKTTPKNKSLDDEVSNPIIIDDSKFVVSLNTQNIEKKYDSLGKTTKSTEDISLSIDKLKNMKG